MASAKQIAWRKKFAKMSKAGKFRKKKTVKSISPQSRYIDVMGTDLIPRTPYVKKSKKSKSNPHPKKTYQKKPLNPKDYGTSKDKHQIPQHMLDELFQTKVRGFPFFAYTGIKDYLLMGNDSLMLTPLPSNPNKISAIEIIYRPDHDAFTIAYYIGNKRTKTDQLRYVGDLGNAIVEIMGIT